ncbi:pseudaminic acid synthase [Ruminococcus sp.]|jgi:N-acetylneuraminate synthase/pseudaminic acid synthase|uniref:pseudaminic acid synthase n=1 Tax=Ruminococcus sp. TaxID=41978 RepID=UPI0025DE1927|nr:pseudaminic acid synthase [Ruminococcus sp.]
MKLFEYMNNKKTYIIAEMSGNHDGKIEKALDIVHAAADAGADCLKIQTYTADTITINCHTEPFLVKTGLWQNDYLYDLYTKAYTPWEWTKTIKEEAEKLGMEFLSTPFDFTAVDFLENIGVGFYKIASFEIVDIPLIRKVAETGKPMIISCGMASEDEIREAVETVKKTGNENLILLKCCSAYPTNYSTMNLRTIIDMKEKFGVPVGLSDHSIGTLTDIAAVALGVPIIEKHICLSKEDKTIDGAFSLDKDEFKQMITDVRNTELSLGRVTYGPSEDEAQSYAHRRSLFAVKDIKAGEVFTPENIRSIRPACGLHTRYYDYFINSKKASRDIPFGTPLTWDDVEK